MKLVVLALVAGGCFIEPARPEQVFGPVGDGKLAAGSRHACAIRDDTTLWCWGDNAHGKLGIVDNALSGPSTGTPIQVEGIGWTSVAAGDDHTCGVRDGQVLCWGSNASGQCGASSSGDVAMTTVSIDATIDRVFAGGLATCVTTVAGELRCWGVVDTTRAAFVAPVPLAPANIVTGWVQVGLADTHGCALSREGETYCWGGNMQLELGGETSGDVGYEAAVHVESGPYATLALATHLTCGVTAKRDFACWGRDVSSGGSSTFTLISSSHDWGGVAVATSEVCSVQNGSVYCFGALDTGVSGSFEVRETLDLQAPITGDTDEIAIGDGFGCLRGTDGRFSCWGSNSYGELGNGEIASERVPTEVQGLRAEAIAVGAAFTCMLGSTDHKLTCWGDNRMHQITAADDALYTMPTATTAGNTYAKIALGSDHVCGVVRPGKTHIECFGDTTDEVVTTGTWQTIEAGANATCATDSNLNGKCWGVVPSYTGSLLTVGNVQILSPEKLYAAKVDAGMAHTLSEWGKQCLLAMEYDSSNPQVLTALGMSSSTVVQLATASDGHGCALATDPTATTALFCWGTNDDYQATSDGGACAWPTIVVPTNNIVWPAVDTATHRQISAAGGHTCALDTAGLAHCWGANTDWTLADIGNAMTPTQISQTAWLELATANHHTCAIDLGGKVYCWGLGRLGELGNGKSFHTGPVDVVLP